MKIKKEPWIIVTEEESGNVFRFNYYTICSVNNSGNGDVRLSQTNGESFKFSGDAAKSCLEQWEKIVNKEQD